MSLITVTPGTTGHKVYRWLPWALLLLTLPLVTRLYTPQHMGWFGTVLAIYALWVLLSKDTGEPIDYAEVRKAFPLDRGRLVVLESEELEKLQPEDSRDVEITRFVDPHEIDHRWYERAYFLGPDGNTKAYFALAAARCG